MVEAEPKGRRKRKRSRRHAMMEINASKVKKSFVFRLFFPYFESFLFYTN